MYSLAFDTCLDKMYVALADNDKVLTTRIIETTKDHYHSAFLISTIKEVLKENSIEPKNINLIATNIGPGSFTGIRACMTVARVFAQAFEIKTVGISSLEILSRLNKSGGKTLVALDARKEKAYAAIYDNGKQILEPQAILLDEVENMIKNGDYFVITEDKLQPLFGGQSYQKSDDDLGKYLIQIANEKVKNNIETNWRKLKPLYIQPPPVTISKKTA